MAAPSKQYGLIFPKKAQQKTFVKHSVFMDDSDEESSVGESLKREALKKQAMKQTKLEIQKALAEDSTVYEYDNIYDDIQQKKAESQASSLAGKAEKKPKYIQNILKAAELRKKEQEKRMEKKIQKEREMEGGAFDDKEAFVTSAYKKKLQERAEEEERERKEAALEACLDVTKQKDLSGFYRHLLNQAVGEEEVPKCSLREARTKEEKPSGDSHDSRQASMSPDERARPHVPLRGGEDPDSDLGRDSSDDESRAEGHAGSRASDEKESRQDGVRRSRESSEHRRGRRDSREDDDGGGGGRKEKSGQPKERDRERRHKGLEKEEHPRRREERDGKQRKTERDEDEREPRRERDREGKGGRWDQPGKERPLHSSDQPKEGERGEADKGAEEEEEEEEETSRERRNSSPGPLGKGDSQAKDSEGRGEKVPRLEGKRRTAGDGAEGQAERALEAQSKFAKRSNEQTVTSARDRYLARQMSRVGAKPYVEKEEGQA